MEQDALDEEYLLEASCGCDALGHAIQAAELYMNAVQEANTAADRKRYRSRFNLLAARAQELKDCVPSCSLRTSNSPVPGSSVLSLVSRLHQVEFPAWGTGLGVEEFVLGPRGVKHVDLTDFRLSPHQRSILDDWRRPDELLGPSVRDAIERPTRSGDNIDLAQDVTTDCSVVAGLCAAMRALVDPSDPLLCSIIFPNDRQQGCVTVSETGKYVCRLYFNGCFRRVTIDDRLPAGRAGRTLYATDDLKPEVIWPALIEKAYLKVRGGYDFPGSNSGSDLFVMTGWIPEQVFLQSEDVDVDKIWRRIGLAYPKTEVFVSLGTGPMDADVEQASGLTSEHNYAVLDLREVYGQKQLLVKNPLRDGAAWKGYVKAVEQGPTASASYNSPTFWMTLEDVAQHFHSIFLNWKPSRFGHREDHHFLWRPPHPLMAACPSFSPQFILSSEAGGPMWILLDRHLSDGESVIARQRTGTLAALSRQLGFICLIVYDANGRRADISDPLVYHGPLVDSSQTLARLNTKAGHLYTVTLLNDGLPLPWYTFTLSAFGHSQLRLREAEDEMAYHQTKLGRWTRASAGGSTLSPRYALNPQFSLAVPHPTRATISMCSDVPARVDVVWARGERIQALTGRDLIAHSGAYTRGCAALRTRFDTAGEYTLVCSTLTAGVAGQFALRIGTEYPATLADARAADTAGRLRTPVPRPILSDGEQKLRISVGAPRLARARVSATRITTLAGPVRITVLLGWPPSDAVVLALSGRGQFRPVGAGASLYTDDFDMEPGPIAQRGLWLLLERSVAGAACARDDGLSVEVLSDVPVEVASQWEAV